MVDPPWWPKFITHLTEFVRTLSLCLHASSLQRYGSDSRKSVSHSPYLLFPLSPQPNSRPYNSFPNIGPSTRFLVLLLLFVGEGVGDVVGLNVLGFSTRKDRRETTGGGEDREGRNVWERRPNVDPIPVFVFVLGLDEKGRT